MVGAEPALDQDAVRAIDVHTHCELSADGHRSLPDHLIAAAERHFHSGDDRPLDLPSVADHYRARALACVVFTVDAEAARGHPPIANEEVLAVPQHKANVWIDLSGWAPKCFQPILVRYAGTLLRDRVLFGSDYPMITPDRWLQELEQLDIPDEVRPAILKHNAARLLALT